jgi:hypothetical protein
MNIRLNQLGGSGGFLGISGGTACFSNAVCVGTNLIVRSAATFCDTVGLFGGSSQLYIGATSNASDFAVLGWCSTNRSLNIQNQSTGNGPQLIIACDGKVGVAVRDPMVQLHVRTNVASESRPTNLATSATNSAVYFTTIGGSSAGIAFGQLGANTSYIQTTYENGAACTPLALNPYQGGVGIGTGNNAFSGQRLFIQSANDQAGITMYNSYDCNMWALATGTSGINNKGFAIRDEINNATRLQIDNCGNIGIGTNVTDVKTHLYNASGRTDLRVESAGGDGAYATLQVKGGGTNAWWTLFTNSSAIGGAVDNLAFYKEGGSAGVKMVITNSGNVGVGTLSPCSVLHTVSSNGTVRFASSTGNDAGRIILMEAALDAWSIDGGQANGTFLIRDEYNSATRLSIANSGNVGINNTVPTAALEINQACSDQTNGGFAFKTMALADNTWTTFFTPPANWAGLTTLNWVGTNDHNRSGAAQIRWSYQPCAAQLGPTTTIFNDSQNATGYFRYSGGNMQICVDGAGAGKRLQILIQGSRGA